MKLVPNRSRFFFDWILSSINHALIVSVLLLFRLSLEREKERERERERERVQPQNLGVL